MSTLFYPAHLHKLFYIHHLHLFDEPNVVLQDYTITTCAGLYPELSVAQGAR